MCLLLRYTSGRQRLCIAFLKIIVDDWGTPVREWKSNNDMVLVFIKLVLTSLSWTPSLKGCWGGSCRPQLKNHWVKAIFSVAGAMRPLCFGPVTFCHLSHRYLNHSLVSYCPLLACGSMCKPSRDKWVHSGKKLQCCF